jgi:hypothetical protein
MDSNNKSLIKRSVHMHEDETFTRCAYSSLNILTRDRDGYVNVSRLCESWGKDVKDLLNDNEWKNSVAAMSNLHNDTYIPCYIIAENLLNPNEFQGYYIHPELSQSAAKFCDEGTGGNSCAIIMARLKQIEFEEAKAISEAWYKNFVSLKTHNNIGFFNQFTYEMQ